MIPRKPLPDAARSAQLVAELRRDQALRQQSYRDRALKLFSHVCARCGREFSGKRLRELTVHHRDHNHENNPPDGRNWELLCLYCHDHEHDKHSIAGFMPGAGARETLPAKGLGNPFDTLDAIVTPPGPTSEPTDPESVAVPPELPPE